MDEISDGEGRQATAGPQGLDDEMGRELLAHYLEGADERLSSFALALGESEARPGDLEALERLRRALHKIAGSAGTYGFPGLTRTARKLEQDAVQARAAPERAAALFQAARGFEREMADCFARASEELRARAPSSAGAAPQPVAPEDSVGVARAAVRERLVVAVISDGAFGAAGAEAVGAALALAGANLVGTGPEHAARGFRQAGGEGLVLWAVPAARSSAGRWIDLPLCAATLAARCAVVAAAADGAIVIGGGAEALAHSAALLREGKPVVALREGGAAASALPGREQDDSGAVAATGAEDAVFELLARLSAEACAR